MGTEIKPTVPIRSLVTRKINGVNTAVILETIPTYGYTEPLRNRKFIDPEDTGDRLKKNPEVCFWLNQIRKPFERFWKEFAKITQTDLIQFQDAIAKELTPFEYFKQGLHKYLVVKGSSCLNDQYKRISRLRDLLSLHFPQSVFGLPEEAGMSSVQRVMIINILIQKGIYYISDLSQIEDKTLLSYDGFGQAIVDKIRSAVTAFKNSSQLEL